MYKIFSFFAGSGFLDLGFEHNNFEVVFMNEYHKPFLDAYKYARQQMSINLPIYGCHNTSIEEYLNKTEQPNRSTELHAYICDARKDGDLIGFIGGPPCPDFSIAGKNFGSDGDNGKLSKSYVKLIIEQRPDFFLFENVKGLWNTAKHRKFYEELKQSLGNAGYILKDELVNSIEYGVPQDRDRILLFGVKKHLLKKQGYTCEGDLEFSFIKSYAVYRQEGIKNLRWPKTNDFCADSVIDVPDGIVKELSIEHWFIKNDVYSHPNSKHFFQPRAGLARMITVQEGDDRKKSYKRLHRWRYSPTAAYGNNEVHLHPYKARRLSAAEAMAIQSLPKEFCLPNNMTLSDMFKTIGNGVPYLLALKVAEAIYRYLEKNIK